LVIQALNMPNLADLTIRVSMTCGHLGLNPTPETVRNLASGATASLS
jgi:hypothetical protein